MDISSATNDVAKVSLDRNEILILVAALNEICNGIEVFEFETRIGANHEFVANLLQRFGSILDKMDDVRD